MRRRPVALVLALVLLAGACSSDDDGEGATRSTTSTSTSSTASTTATTTTGAVCRGLGDAPPAGIGVVTWVADGKLLDADGCLVEVRAGASPTPRARCTSCGPATPPRWPTA